MTTTTVKTSDTDWKARYREVCEELEAQRRSSSQAENNLFKAVLRLAFGFSGRDRDFDRELAGLPDALRKGADADERRTRIQDMLGAIARLAEPAAADTADPGAAALAALLEALPCAPEAAFEVRQLRERLLRSDKPLPADEAVPEIAALLAGLTAPEPAATAADGPLATILEGLRLGGEPGIALLALRRRCKACADRKAELALAGETVELVQRALSERPRGRIGTDTVSTADLATVVIELIDWLSLPEAVAEAVEALKGKLLDADLDRQGLTSALKEVADIVVDLHAGLETEVATLERFLLQLGARLDDVERRLAHSRTDHGESLQASADLHDDLQAQLLAMETDGATLPDPDSLRHLIGERVESLSSRLDSFLASEQERHQSASERLAEMQGLLSNLEGETRQLRQTIATERNRALTDALTGLPNRRALRDVLEHCHEQFHLHGTPQCLAVIDIDFFKRVNDEFGHAVGDRVLVHVARQCRSRLDEADFLARFGGEEFVVVMPGRKPGEAAIIVEHLRAEVERIRFHLKGRPVPVTLSGGIASFGAGESISAVVERADAALYRAKAGGRNRVEAD